VVALESPAATSGRFPAAVQGDFDMGEIGGDAVGFLGQIGWVDVGYATAVTVGVLVVLSAVQWTVDEWRLWRWRKRLPD